MKPNPARVARIPYLNAAPFYHDWETLESASEGRWKGTVLPPRQLGQAAEAGEVDAGLMAVADLIRLQESFEPLWVPSRGAPVSFGIANRDQVYSVLLFLRTDLLDFPSEGESGRAPVHGGIRRYLPRLLSEREARSLQGTTIGITGETSTSFRLLRLLLEIRHGVQPAHYERGDLRLERSYGAPVGVHGALVIGDLALRWLHRPPAGMALAMDLAAAWNHWTGLPFVFARWGVRRSCDPASKEWLGLFLERSLEATEHRLESLVAHLPSELGSKEGLAAYLRNFTYRLGEEELAAVKQFQELLAEYRIDC